jgi:DNA invertase Pin-like site-specific DNA recombinase
MAAEPGPDFRWGIVPRVSKFRRTEVHDETTGEKRIELTEESTRRQEQAVRSHLLRENMGKVVAVYPDVKSAYNGAKRTGFEAALIDLKAGRIDGIAVWKIDRLVRRTSQFRQVLNVLESSGGRLFSLCEGIDTATEDASAKAITNIVLSILVTLAEMESDNTSTRVHLFHEERARMRKPHRGVCRPFGHNEQWSALVPEEAALIEEAASRILNGDGKTTIAEDWNRRGIKTAQGRIWRAGTLGTVLTSPRMVGKREYGGSLFDLEGVPNILDVKTWERLCAKLEERATQQVPKMTRLVSGIAICGGCESPVIGSQDRGSVRTYICRSRPAAPNACGSLWALGDSVDAHVSERVIEFIADKERMSKLLRLHARGPEMEALHDRIGELSEAQTRLDQALNPPPGTPAMKIETYWSLSAAIENERRTLHRRLAVSREAALLAETLNFEEGEAAEVWAERNQDWRRAIIALVTERIVIEQRGSGGKKGGINRFDPERVRITFADEQA